MYNSSKNIFTGILCFVVVAAILVGALFACGVFKKDTTTGTKLPIVYPDKNINWVQVNDTTLRASFNDQLNINPKQKSIIITMYVNDISEKITMYLTQSETNNELSYEVWHRDGGVNGYEQFGIYDKATETEQSYRIKVVMYNNATLTDAGDVTSGKGFVLEFGGFDKVTNNDSGDVYTPVAIEKIKITAIYQQGDNDKLLA